MDFADVLEVKEPHKRRGTEEVLKGQRIFAHIA